MPNTSTRLASADILKAVSIVAAVFFHVALLFPFEPYPSEYSSHLRPALYLNWLGPIFRFGVPVFVVVWAYFTELGLQKRGNKYGYLLSRFRQLLIPFIFWSTVYFLVSVDLKTISIKEIITKYGTGYGWLGQYYFIILFQLLILFVPIRFFSRYVGRLLGIFILLSAGLYVFWAYSAWFHNGLVGKLGDRFFLYWLPYAVVGIGLARRPWRNPLSGGLTVTVALLALLLIPLDSNVISSDNALSTDPNPYVRPGVFVAAVALVWLLLGRPVFYQQLRPWLARVVGVLARNTLGIFCLNPLATVLLLPRFHASRYYFHFPGCSFVVPALSVGLVIGACLLLIALLKRLRLGVLVAN